MRRKDTRIAESTESVSVQAKKPTAVVSAEEQLVTPSDTPYSPGPQPPVQR